MVKCERCNEEIEWVKSEKSGKFYPINVGKNKGDQDYFHSKTCKPKKIEEKVSQQNVVNDEMEIRKMAFNGALEVVKFFSYVDRNEMVNDIGSMMEKFVKFIKGEKQ